MVCTARIETDIVISCRDTGYFILPFKSESLLSCHLSFDDIKIGKAIGKGAFERIIKSVVKFWWNRFGSVFIGKYREELVAIKQVAKKFSNKKIEIEEEENSQILKEIAIMTQLRSPFIVSFYGTAVSYIL